MLPRSAIHFNLLATTINTMTMAVDPQFAQLLQLGALVQDAITKYLVDEYQDGQHCAVSSDGSLPTWPQFNAQRCLLAASGSLTEAVSDPASRLLEVSSQYFEARALHIAADQRIPDALAVSRTGSDQDGGIDLATLASSTGIESRKLGRIMRCLCSIHIFREVAPDCFANNRISAVLVGNEPLRAYILML